METPNFQQYTNEQQYPVQEQQSVQPVADDNPFNDERYGGVNLPDAPLQYGSSMVENLLNNDEVPDEIKRKFWFVFHKDNVLTFLDEPRQQRKLNSYDIMKIDMLNSMPYYDYTFDKELQFNIIRNILETKLDRARGVQGGNVKNERIMLQSQFSENRQISEQGEFNGPIKEGFFKRLLGRR